MKIRICTEYPFCSGCDTELDRSTLYFENIELPSRYLNKSAQFFDPHDMIGKRITHVAESLEVEEALIFTLE